MYVDRTGGESGCGVKGRATFTEAEKPRRGAGLGGKGQSEALGQVICA